MATLTGGLLNLTVGVASTGKSVATSQYHERALRVMRPHYLDHTGQVCYTIINPGGGYLGSDTYDITISVGDHASLLLTTQSATKVYRTPQGPARQNLTATVGASATWEYLPDQLIVYREGTYEQHTTLDITPTSTVVMGEVITPGWSPEGTQFSFHELRLNTEVTLDGELFLMDRLRIVPDHTTAGIGFMEGFSHTGQMLVIAALSDEHVDSIAALLHDWDSAHDTRSGLSRVGLPLDNAPCALMIRTLGASTESIMQLHEALANTVRQHTTGQGPVQLRKY